MKAKNLLSHFPKTVEWSLVVNTVIAICLALFVHVYGGVFSLIISALLFWILFYIETTERGVYIRSYLVYVVLLLTWAEYLDASIYSGIIFALCAGVGMVVWIGIVRFLFKRKELILSLFHTALVYGALLFSVVSSGFISALFGAFVSGLLLYELCIQHQFPWKKRILLISAGTGFFIFEFILLVRALPLSAIAGAGVLSLLVLGVRDLVVAHCSGGLNRRYVLEQVILFAGVCILLFMTGRWVI